LSCGNKTFKRSLAICESGAQGAQSRPLASAAHKMHAPVLLAISAAACACVRVNAASDTRNTAATAEVTVLASGNATSPFGQLLMAYYSGEKTVSPGGEVAGGGRPTAARPTACH
jgi:hypothetical protein